jgi:hypothetical protein
VPPAPAPTPTPTPQPPGPNPTPTCAYTIKPTWYDAGRGPDDIRIAVTADPGCMWTATSTVPWVTIAQGASGSGTGTVELLVPANSGPARAVLAGQPFALSQHGSE